MTDTTTLAPTDAELHDLADRCTPNTETGSLNYRDFARAILAKWGAPATASGEPVAEVISHVDADGLPKHPVKLWGEYASKVESLEREAAGLRQRMRKYESSAPTKAFAALTYYRDQVCDEDGPTTKEFHRLLAEALSAPPAQEVQLNPDMPVQELRLHMGELTTDEVLVARAAIRWANSQQEARVPLKVREFEEWLNDHRGASVSEVFHDVVAHYKAARSIAITAAQKEAP